MFLQRFSFHSVGAMSPWWHIRAGACRRVVSLDVRSLHIWMWNLNFIALTPLECMCYVQDICLERLRLHHAARQMSSSQRRAERFAYINKTEEDEGLVEGGCLIFFFF